MPASQPLPRLWLLSDARNDTALERALRRLPRGSGLVFRHYHLPETERLARYRRLRRLAKARGHLVVLAGTARAARGWRADAHYASSGRGGGLAIMTAHDMREIGAANRHGAAALMLSPVFATRSHPGAATLGPVRFRLMAAHAQMPVIALGGMTPARARRLGWPRWAAIDGLSTPFARTDS